MKTILLLSSLLYLSTASQAQLNAEFNWCPVFDTTSQLCCIQFLDQSTDTGGIIVSYMYDFGDGSIGTQKDPKHCYFVLGTYLVTLVVTDNFGNSDTVMHPIAITHLDSTGCNCNSIGINEINNSWNFRLSPSPFHNTAMLSWNFQQANNACKLQISIYDLRGALLRESIFPAGNGIGEAKIVRGDLVEGMYFFEIKKLENHMGNTQSGKELIGTGKFLIE